MSNHQNAIIGMNKHDFGLSKKFYFDILSCDISLSSYYVRFLRNYDKVFLKKKPNCFQNIRMLFFTYILKKSGTIH